ncbi:MAG: hypothetical protein QOJ75_760, partial [Chloroflexota bacterium]|nr:hypothetical protein [Chloroflexota bacterium]
MSKQTSSQFKRIILIVALGATVAALTASTTLGALVN